MRAFPSRFEAVGSVPFSVPTEPEKRRSLKLLLGILKPSSGEMLLSGMPIGRMSPPRGVPASSLYPAGVSLRFPLSVFEFVLLGRKPWFVWGPSPSDVALTGTVLSRLDLDALAERPLANLSGGQRQKVALARALVQETDWLLLDEPTSSLDLRHQVEVLTTARRVATKQGKGVILSMHDINLATRYADTILLMKDGGIVASGAPADVLTGERIASVYGLPMRAFHAADNPQVSLWFPDTTEEGAVFPSRSGIFQEEDMEQ